MEERTDDSDDDKPLVQPKNKPAAPKAKAKPRAKPKSAIEKEKGRQSRVRAKKRAEMEDNAPLSELILETPLPKAKKRAKNAPSEKEENTKNILRASKNAAAKPTPAKKQVESFYIGDDEKRKAGDNIPNPRLPKHLRVR